MIAIIIIIIEKNQKRHLKSQKAQFFVFFFNCPEVMR